MSQQIFSNSKSVLILKIALYLIIAVVLLYVGFLAFIVAGFATDGVFYMYVAFFGTLSLLALIFIQLFRIGKSKIRKIAWFSFLAVFLVSCGIHEALNAHDRSILRIGENNVDLTLYAPFAENTKAVSLEEKSILKLESDLPLLDGATAMYPLYAAFARAVYPEKEYRLYNSEVMCNNTIGAYESLINKKVDIIFVAQPSQEQKEMAERAGVEFRYTPVGKEAFVFFVNARNKVENLSIEQLQNIYSEKITNWKEVGGNDEIIRAFQRNENSGSQTAFRHFMQGVEIMNPPEDDRVYGMGRIISQAASYTNYRNSIGFSFRFYANEMVNEKGIRLLEINGNLPDLESIKNDTYPMVAQFFAISLADNNKENVLKLLDWITSEQGQYLVEKTGYFPISE